MPNPMRVLENRLDDDTRDLLGKDLSGRVAGRVLDSDADAAILGRIGAYALRNALPGRVLDSLQGFAISGAHVLRLGNLPQQALPATPVSGFAAEAQLPLINAVHLGLLQILGVLPYAVEYENDGRLIRNVVPNPSAAGKTSSWGSDAEFFWHTDNPHLPFGEPGTDPRPYPPRYLTFYAVRNEEQVPTELVAVESAVARLPDETVRRLTAPAFAVGAPDSNDTKAELADTAVLDWRCDGHWARFDQGTTRAQTPAAEQALREWTDALRSAESSAPVLQPGEFLIFDNYRVLHRRRAFTPAAADRARWLRRCYAS